MLSILIFIIILSILIIMHELGHFIVARRAGVKVEIFSLGFGPRLFNFKKKDTQYSVGIFPLGGYVKLAGDNWDEYKGNRWEYLAQPIKQRLKILVAGSLSNYILAFFCLWIVFYIGYPMLTTKIGALIKDMPAAQVGLKVDDQVLNINGKEIKYWDELQKAIQDSKDESILLSVLRNGRTLQINIPVQKKEITTIWGDKKIVSQIGIVPKGEITYTRHGFINSFFLSIKKVWEWTYITCKGIVWLILRRISVRESITGPVGMFFITKGAISAGFSAVLHMMAVVSLSLSIFNLLPLPILDGGHIVLLGLEKIRGRDFIKRFDKIWSRLGLSFILLIGILVFYNDLIKFEVVEKIIKLFRK